MDANGHAYVDLGLPSGTLWATCNIGASKPSESGLYFQWGDTSGYTKEQVGIGEGKKKFASNWSDYKFSINGSSSNFSKYTTIGATLELADDAANANMGGSWHMPSPDQIQELIDNTTTALTTSDGVSGMTFTSKKNGKSIFIPTAGYACDGSVDNGGNEAYVWSSTLYMEDVGGGQSLFSDTGDVVLDVYGRRFGLSVRGVLG